MKNKALILTLFMVLLVGLCGNASAYTVTVFGKNNTLAFPSGNSNPVDTGLTLTTGQQFSISNIRGQFVLSLDIAPYNTFATATVNPDGTSINPIFDQKAIGPYYLGTLVGQVGRGAIFNTTSQPPRTPVDPSNPTNGYIYNYTGTADADGKLYLSMWGFPSGTPISITGDEKIYTEANCGVVYADVSATPIPGAAWLLGSGIVGLIGLKRKKNNKA